MSLPLDIPGWGAIELTYLVLDLNGTVALDGEVLLGVAERLTALSARLAIYLATADTHGRPEAVGERLGLSLLRIAPGNEVEQKEARVERLGAVQVIAIGNGSNDAHMLSAAALGIAARRVGPEGVAVPALQAADVVVGQVTDALDLLLYPQRLVATLRR